MNKFFKTVLCILAGAAFIALVGWVTMELWNWLVPALFSGPSITLWQALGLLLLLKILFGFGGKSCGHSRKTAWKRRYFEKFKNMSPEERARIKEKMREKWCSSSASTSRVNSGPSTETDTTRPDFLKK